MSAGEVKAHEDGWRSTMTGLGTRRDKIESMTTNNARMFTDAELTQFYAGDGLAAAVVDQVAQDMVQSGFEVEGDKGKLYKFFRTIGLNKALQKAFSASRLYGGALLVMDFEKEGFDKPLGEKVTKPIKGFKVYPRSRIEWSPKDMVKDPNSPYFESFERFKVKKLDGNGTFDVHASKAFVVKGCEVLDATQKVGLDEFAFWGTSIMGRMWHPMACYGSFIQGLGQLGNEMVIGKYTISNLEQMVATGNWKAIDVRLGAIDTQKSTINGVLLGENENYTRDAVALTGVDKCIEQLMMACSASCRIPVTKLFGRSASGENATGEGDEKEYNKLIRDYQENDLLPILIGIIKVANGYLKVLKGEDALMPDVFFNPLFLDTEKERAETKKLMAEADKIYMETGVLTNEEVRNNRFVGGYCQETDVKQLSAVELNREVVPPVEGTRETRESVQGGVEGSPREGEEGTPSEAEE